MVVQTTFGWTMAVACTMQGVHTATAVVATAATLGASIIVVVVVIITLGFSGHGITFTMMRFTLFITQVLVLKIW